MSVLHDSLAKRGAFFNSPFLSNLSTRRLKGLPTVLLATDIDQTFVSNHLIDQSKEEVQIAQEITANIALQLQKSNIPLMYVSGNSIDGICTRIAKGELPLPEVISSAVGTEIWVLANSEQVIDDAKHVTLPGGTTHFFVHDPDFDDILLLSGYDRRRLTEMSLEFIETSRLRDMSLESTERRRLQFQQPFQEVAYLADPFRSASQPYKLSFYFYASRAELAREFTKMAEDFFCHRAIMCEEIIHNSQLNTSTTCKKYCLDILPITKADSVNYLGETADIDFTIVAGDSGNDAAMLEESGDLAIVVGGAKKELVEHINRLLEGEKSAYGSDSFLSVEKTDGGRKIYYQSDILGPGSIERALHLFEQTLHT